MRCLGVSNRFSKGFTLRELIATLGVLGLFGVLQIAGMGYSKGAGQAARCLHNLRQLGVAWQMYAKDNDGWFAPNDGSSGFDMNRPTWVAGHAGLLPDATNVVLLTDSRYSKLAAYTKDRYQLYRCPSDSSAVLSGNRYLPRTRSYAMNHAVGTKSDRLEPVDGPWLTGSYGVNNSLRGPYQTFGRVSDMQAFGPSRLFIMCGEDPYSINDCMLSLSMRSGESAQLIDFPATFHGFGAGFVFGDGHAELHLWTDPRMGVTDGNVFRRFIPNSPDMDWLQERASRLIDE